MSKKKVQQFEDLIVWQKSKQLSLAIYEATSKGRFAKDFGLRDQIQRAAVSVMSNIAEGFERYNNKEFNRFLAISRGSVAEVRSQLYLAKELHYVTEDDFKLLHDLCIEIGRLIGGLRNSLKLS